MVTSPFCWPQNMQSSSFQCTDVQTHMDTCTQFSPTRAILNSKSWLWTILASKGNWRSKTAAAARREAEPQLPEGKPAHTAGCTKRALMNPRWTGPHHLHFSLCQTVMWDVMLSINSPVSMHKNALVHLELESVPCIWFCNIMNGQILGNEVKGLTRHWTTSKVIFLNATTNITHK